MAKKGSSRAERKRRTVVSLRWVLILASSSLILFNSRASDVSQTHSIIALLLASNFALTLLPRRVFISRYFDSSLVCADIAIVSASIYLTGQVNSDFFLLYFLVIMTAALSETPKALLWSAAVVCGVYLAMIERLEGLDALLSTDVLIRIPFFCIVSIFYGHLTQTARRQERAKRNLQNKLNRVAQVRRFSRFFSNALSRGDVLRGLVKAERKLCNSERVIILSRGSKRIVAQSSSQPISEAEFEKLLTGINSAVGEYGLDILERVISPDAIKAGATIRGGGFTLIPLTGKLNSDLFLGIEGSLSDELVDHAKLLLLNAVLALKNAGQYQALLQEVEKRKSLFHDLQSALKLKSGFVANVSHELRTPVNAMIGFGELLLEGSYGDLPGEVEHVLKRMLNNATSLRELINDILDFSKLEAGASKLEITPGETKLFLEEVLETSSALIRDKSISLVGSGDSGNVELDWKLFRQIALNLISNAIKFTPKGEVKVTLDLSDLELSLTVSDTGIGISETELTRIFEPFKQVDNAYTKRFAGTGLGLSITKRQIELLGGCIQVRSVEGKGSEFKVQIPITRISKADGEEAPVRADTLI